MRSDHQWNGLDTAREVCRALKNNKKAVNIVKNHYNKKSYAQKNQKIEFVLETKPVNWPTDLQKRNIYINEEGMCELLVRS